MHDRGLARAFRQYGSVHPQRSSQHMGRKDARQPLHELLLHLIQFPRKARLISWLIGV
jgi:hypothetical protein